MDEENAASIIKIAIGFDVGIGSLFTEVERISDIELRKKLKQSAEKLMALIAVEIIFPIEKKFPSLKEK